MIIPRRKHQKRRRICLAALCMVWLFVMQSLIPVGAETLKKETVRVGFFAWEGYHVEDKRGIKSGYGYDFFKMAESYNDWKYEYIGYDKSWDEILTMLEKGQVDVVTSAQKTPEWEAKFDYSESPVGTSSSIISVKNGDKRYAIGDPSTYNGIRVGMLKGSSRNAKLKAFAKKENFTYTPVYYDNMKDMQADFQLGKKVDAMLTSNLRTFHDETVLEEFDPMDYYAIVKKGNKKLLDEINFAISQMDVETPGWRTSLKNKYFADTDNKVLKFNYAEAEYLKQVKKEKKVFQVTINPDLAPYSYFEKGKAKGIAVEIFKEIAQRVGISYQFIECKTYKEYNKLVKDQKADIDLTCFSNYGLAEFHHVNLTNPYMATTMSRVTTSDFKGKIRKLAILKGFNNTTTYADEIIKSAATKEYDTRTECLDAVLDEKADAVYMYTYAAEKAVEENARNQLKYTTLPEYSVDLAIGVKDSEDRRLLSILNEGISNVKGNSTQKIIQTEVENFSHNDTFLALIYDYPGIVMGMCALIFVLILVIVIALIRKKNNQKEREQADELARFMLYVCETYETVQEINLDTMQCITHNVEDGKVVSEENVYHPDEMVSLEMDEKKENKYFEIKQEGKDGKSRWYSYSLRAIPKDAKHPNNVVLFKKNINQAKKEEERQRNLLEDALQTAQNASQAKGLFLSRMSHEIRTPLNAVIGYMDIAKDAKDNPEKMFHCVENSDMAAKHLLSIINDVLDISSIESGKMKLSFEEFDLKKQLTSITSIFFHQAKEKGVIFDTKLKGITQEWVVGDELRTNQILMNLLSNAVKFTPEGGTVVFTVSQMNLTEQRVYMKFEVKDSGIGMSNEYKEKLFVPFEQESAVTAKKYGGTGLGLSITHNLIQMMGGSIDVQSKQGKGSTFTASLYFGTCEQKHMVEGMNHDYSMVRALIVDDDRGSLEHMKEMLKRCHVKSDIVSSGKAAVKQIKRRMSTEYKYNLCIMDWNMPEMNGIEAARLIREECKEDLPIIIATAYDVTEVEEEAKAVGVDRVISKPLFQSTMFDLLVSTYGKYEPIVTKEERTRNLKGLHALLAEDNEMNMEIAVEILNKAGITVDQAVNGQEAVEMFMKSEPGFYDVILMDIQMPILDGHEATGVIRTSDHPEAKTIPIIAMTANAFAEDITAALASGMNDHIAKPIDYDKLFTVLDKIYTERQKEEKS